ncbi:MAG: WXG100 family type VII secretion target [Jatrophihabitans sp.]
MADTIAVNFGQLSQASSDCKSIAGNLQSQLDQLQTYLNSLVWTGAAREAYQADQTMWNKGAQEIREALDTTSAAVTRAQAGFEAAENANRRRFRG